MGSLGSIDGEFRHIQRDSDIRIGDTESQNSDSHSSPSSCGEGEDCRLQLKSAAPLPDTVPYNDLIGTQAMDFDETQPIDFEEETQAVNHAFETQVMDLAGETQVLDDYDWVENMDTQLFDESDKEDSKRTKVLSDDDGSVDIQLPVRIEDQAADSEEMGPDNSDSHQVAKGNTKEKDFGGENRSRNGCSLVRRLFAEDVDIVQEDFRDDINDARGLGPSKLPAHDNELAGLSYIDSQEPGDLSQANALEVVDRFLKVNVLDSDQEMNHGNIKGEKLNPTSITKGQQSVANRNLRSTLAGGAIFDWDDRREDEGGGEFFTKKKDAFFGTNTGYRKSCTQPRRPRFLKSKESKTCGNLRNEEELQNIHEKIMGFLHSDSKLVLSNGRKPIQHGEMNLRKNLYRDMVDQSSVDPTGAQGEVSAPNDEMTDMLNIGPDTQMAAEAMEVLSSGVGLARNDAVSGHQDGKNHKAVRKREVTESVVRTRNRGQKRPYLSNSGVATRSKRTSGVALRLHEEFKFSVASRTRSRNATTQVGVDVMQAKPNRRQLNKGDQSTVIGSRDKIPSRTSDMEAMSNIEANNDCEGSLPVKRQFYRPVACRTRRQVAVNNLDGDYNVSVRSKRGLAERNKRKGCARSDEASENLKTRDNTTKLTSATDHVIIDGSGCVGRDSWHMASKENGAGEARRLSTVSAGPGSSGATVTRRQRSKTIVRCTGDLQHGRSIQPRRPSLLSERISPDLRSKIGDPCVSPSSKGMEASTMDGLPPEIQDPSTSVCNTPVGSKTPANAISPICMGSGYFTQSYKKLPRSSLKKELKSLIVSEHECISPGKDLRKRKDMTNIRVLFSHHLEEDVIRKQKKILVRLGVSAASSILEATHFVADEFLRTRNMLEAIACGKPVVTPLWLESCAEASCFIDEKNYILRDAKKEKEFGFCMPVSLARASKHPLLQDRRVIITPNTKPSKDIISSLVKAVHGRAIERMGRSILKDDDLPDDLLVLSCEEDYEICMPFLEKGAAVYDSELLLNGIITQKLEYERHRLFVDQERRTRATRWLKKDGKQFVPVKTKA